MNAADLASELLSLDHPRRVRRLVEAGRLARSEPAVADLLRRWEQGDWQERQWALTACWGSGDADRPARLLDDSSRSLGALACRLLALLGDDGQAAQALRTLPEKRRGRLLRQLHRRRRKPLIADFVHGLQAQGDPRALKLQALVGGTPAADAPLDAASWQRRAAVDPDATARHLTQTLDAAARPDGLLAWAAVAALPILSVARPGLALGVVRSLRGHLPLGQLPLRVLLERLPDEVADLALAEASPVPLDFSRVVGRLARGKLLALLERQPGTLPAPAEWLKRLDADARAEVFRQEGAGWRDADGCLPVALLARLPTALREAEARRHLGLAVLETRPLVLAAYLGFLPWEEARTRLQGWFQHPEAEMRAAAWQALSGAARYHASRMGELLGLVRQRRYEQDPVRLAFLTGLAELPPGRWTDEALPELVGVVRETLDATDLSVHSVNALARLLWGLALRRPDWAAGQLALLFRERGPVFWLPLQDRLTDDQARRLEGSLAPVYESWGAGNRGGWLVGVAHSLGCRLRVCGRLLAALRGLLTQERERHGSLALELLRQHLPAAEFDALVEELLRRDPSWVSEGSVFQRLYRRRQDLLTPFLHQAVLPGRHGRRDLVRVLPPSGHERLTAPQQQKLASTLAGLTRLAPGREVPRDSWAILLALGHLSRLPAADHGRLIELARDERPLLRDAALRALGRLDAGQGLPTLLEALGDERARVAIYAARTSLAELPPERVLALLRGLPLQKVTVAKEALRLAGEFGGPTAFDWLQELDGQELHRDVRIALLRALWDHLEKPEAWGPLTRAAAEADGRLLAGVIRIPAATLSRAARARLIDLLAGLTSHPQPTVRVAVFQRFAALPVPDPARTLLGRSLAASAAAPADERAAATLAALALATAEDAERVRGAVAALLPRRLALAVWVAATARATEANRERLAPLAHATLAALQTDPLTVSLEPSLALAADGVAGLRGLVRRPGLPLHADALRSLEAALELCARRPDRGELEALEDELAGGGDERLRRLAVAALRVAAQDGQGWTDARRARLARYGADPSPLVAGAAQFVFPPESQH